MYIKKLNIVNFRNYKNLFLEFNRHVNIFTGDNAQGKTNILESIYFCSLGKSHRTNRDSELINWNSDNAYINILVGKERLDKKIEIKIFKENKKGVNINSKKLSKLSELIGVFNVVMFSPEDLKIIKGSPQNRRKLLDVELCKLNPQYYYNLAQYNKVLNEKNIVLKKFNNKDKGIIDIYNSQLSQYGAEIIKQRIIFINKLNEKGKKIHSGITSNQEKIDFKYMTSIKKFENIQQELYQALTESINNDIDKRTTLIGPHRDDFLVSLNGVNARIYGSQGQQRTAVLTIKFATLDIIKEYIGEYPVLLLDDVLSELDAKRQKFILNSINDMQTIITCTGIKDIKNYIESDVKIFYVKNGEIG
jgi:DNA replication and repair protein RecF